MALDALAGFSKKLRGIAVVAAGADGTAQHRAAFRDVLEEVARWVVRSCVIVTTAPFTKPSEPQQLCVQHWATDELELYCNHADMHPDTFTHGSPEQQTAGSWYFHKAGGSYKNGTYKGLDITLGWEKDGLCQAAPVGLLVRSIRRVATTDPPNATPLRVEGPSLTVDALLAATGAASVSELAGPPSGTAAPLRVNSERLWLLASTEQPVAPQPTTAAAILQGPRIGLVPRRLEDLRFVCRAYRFVSQPPGTTIAKGRPGLAAMIFARGATSGSDGCSAKPSGFFKDVPEVCRITGCAPKSATAVLANVEAGARRSAPGDLLGGDVTKSEVIAALVGYCAACGHM